MSGRRLLPALALVVAASLVGCDGSEPPTAEAVRAHLEQAFPGAEFKRETRIRLGRFAFGFVKGVFRWTPLGDAETSSALAHVRRVEIASYEVISMPDGAALEIPSRLERRLAGDGWYPMIKSREEDAYTWIFVREGEGGEIRNLYIVELDAAELTVIDLAGRLDRLTAELVADDPDGFVASLGS